MLLILTVHLIFNDISGIFSIVHSHNATNHLKYIMLSWSGWLYLPVCVFSALAISVNIKCSGESLVWATCFRFEGSISWKHIKPFLGLLPRKLAWTVFYVTEALYMFLFCDCLVPNQWMLLSTPQTFSPCWNPYWSRTSLVLVED